MKVDLRTPGYDNDAVYYVTTDLDLLESTEIDFSEDFVLMRVLVNGFYPGTYEQYKQWIKEEALRQANIKI